MKEPTGTPFFVMRCNPSDEMGRYLHIHDGLTIPGIGSWRVGQRFAAPVPEPLVFEATPEGDGRLLPAQMWDGTILLLSRELVTALQGAGVDNLDTYRAVIRDEVSGETHDGHLAVNIIGLVAAADLGRSENVVVDRIPLFDVSFESLALREGLPLDLRMFRLAENNSTILVHADVRAKVLDAGIAGIRFLDPAKFVRA